MYGNSCIGIGAMSGAMLAMYGCTAEHALWGVAAGSHDKADVLLQHNTFRKIDHEDITDMYHEEHTGQTVQPWSKWLLSWPGTHVP